MGLRQNAGRTGDRSTWKKIQGQGMSLEGGVPIGLGEVTGIAGLGEKAQVGEAQVSDHLGLLPEPGQVGAHHEMRLDENRRQEQDAAAAKEQKAIGFSQGLVSIPSVVRPDCPPAGLLRAATELSLIGPRFLSVRG
jgi:hypothetical protein